MAEAKAVAARRRGFRISNSEARLKAALEAVEEALAVLERRGAPRLSHEPSHWERALYYLRDAKDELEVATGDGQ
jgi:hypothetical protein